ncbi:glycosyltransferase family 2 protein [Kineococcus gynurae]|uniref:Glycosyltransferase family 2 protein n=1 Tax=Kineococcus gynurae TaxID=452979 RepID=A0ABV5LXU0_9ACTN
MLSVSDDTRNSEDPAVAPPPTPGREELHVIVAVLTYRRPDDLAALLPELGRQSGHRALAVGDGRVHPATRAEVEVLIVDNDPVAQPSVRRLVEAAGAAYVHEPNPGIAAGRNRALDEALARGADVLVFLDDDERPGPDWLAHLLDTYARTGAGAVVGPVVSEFAVDLDPWMRAGRFFDRRRLPTGTPVTVAATNNLLLDLFMLRRTAIRFDERYGLTGGSDTLFTRRLAMAGVEMVWCDEAVVVDVVPPERCRPEWVLRRARRSGNGWSRTTLTLTQGSLPRVLARVRLSAQGAVRLGGGALRLGAGRVTQRLDWQARGARTLERGRGLLGGAWGRVETEYARPTGTATGDRTPG